MGLMSHTKRCTNADYVRIFRNQSGLPRQPYECVCVSQDIARICAECDCQACYQGNSERCTNRRDEVES